MSSIEIKKNILLKEIENIRKLLTLIETRIEQLEYNKKVFQSNKLTEYNLKKDYTNKLLKRLEKRRDLNLKLRNENNTKKPVQCSGMNIVEDHLERCTNITNTKYCEEHQERYKYEKPDDCPICMDTISEQTEIPLSCGHWIHKDCLVPTNLHICPVCRQKMKQVDVKYIFGEEHQERNLYAHNYYIPFEQGQNVNVPIIVQNNYPDLHDFLSEPDPLLEMYIPTSPFYNITKRDITEQLRRVFVNARNNILTYFNNVNENYYYVPEYLNEKLNTFTDIMIDTSIRHNLRRETVEFIRNNINNSTESKKIYISKIFKFLFNILIINDFRGDILIQLLSNLTVSKLIVTLEP